MAAMLAWRTTNDVSTVVRARSLTMKPPSAVEDFVGFVGAILFASSGVSRSQVLVVFYSKNADKCCYNPNIAYTL